MTKKVVVIGAGFGGMTAAAYLARSGYDVTVVEKNDQVGGRARVIQRGGFTWDLGPSWYMMPDVFEEFFADFGAVPSDYYALKRLDPSYRVFDTQSDAIDVQDNERAVATFEQLNPGDGVGLSKLLAKTAQEYSAIRGDVLGKDWHSVWQAADPRVLKFLLNPAMLMSYDHRVSTYVKSERLMHIMEFMTVFMGGSPKNIPGMYTLLAHVDMGLKIWYPMGGFGSVARAFQAIGEKEGVEYRLSAPVETIIVRNGRTAGVRLESGEEIACDIVVANADYHHVDSTLVPREFRAFSDAAWRRKTLSPSGLVICLGVKKRLPKLQHHNLFFDTDWDTHFDRVFTKKVWSEEPLLYVCAPSKSDPSIAPVGTENLFILAPQANGSQPDETTLQRTVDKIIARIEQKIDTPFAAEIVAREVCAHDYFTQTFNAYQGNAFGLAHTLLQSAPFRPPIASKKLPGLYHVGHYTNPGTGVPMVVLSGKVAAAAVERYEH